MTSHVKHHENGFFIEVEGKNVFVADKNALLLSVFSVFISPLYVEFSEIN